MSFPEGTFQGQMARFFMATLTQSSRTSTWDFGAGVNRFLSEPLEDTLTQCTRLIHSSGIDTKIFAAGQSRILPEWLVRHQPPPLAQCLEKNSFWVPNRGSGKVKIYPLLVPWAIWKQHRKFGYVSIVVFRGTHSPQNNT